eukprot:2751253-Amphidinium_carterae.1
MLVLICVVDRIVMCSSRTFAAERQSGLRQASSRSALRRVDNDTLLWTCRCSLPCSLSRQDLQITP